jgi:hypothetical protein
VPTKLDLIAPSVAAGLLGLGVDRVRDLDAELGAIRVDGGGRVFQRAAVERYAARRDRAAAARQLAKPTRSR